MLTVRYKTKADDRERVKSNVTENIYNVVSKSRDIRFAYPHNEVILRKMKSGKV